MQMVSENTSILKTAFGIFKNEGVWHTIIN